ncbi:MAG: dihydroorotase [Oscillospiraceae bacterium]|nr:dihydroorotase [Oscillospiraceae bacterium]
MDILFKNGRIIDPASGRDMIGDLLVRDGRIAEIGNTIQGITESVEDCSGKIIAPGFVEMHAHMRDFNERDRETFFTGSCSAASGGFTSVGVMPNSNPVIDTPEMVKAVRRRAAQSAVIRLYPFGAVTIGREGKIVADLCGMAAAGAVAFSDDGNAIPTATMMRDILELTKRADRVVDVHCEDKSYTGDGIVNAGPLAEKLGLPGIPSAAEDVEIARDLIVQEEVGGHLHIAHLGSERAVELIRFFRRRGVDFSCEVIPHQFSRTEDIVPEKGTRAKVKPPFRGEKDVQGIRRGLRDQLIDVIASDHCPYTDAEIAGDLAGTKLFGLAGFETTLPLALDMVRLGIIDYPYLVRCLTSRPAQILRLKNRGTLSIGADADITVIDPDSKWVVSRQTMHSKASNTPYLGETMIGRPALTMVGGEVVCRYGEIIKDKLELED